MAGEVDLPDIGQWGHQYSRNLTEHQLLRQQRPQQACRVYRENNSSIAYSHL